MEETFLVEFDPTGRMGAAGNERIDITIGADDIDISLDLIDSLRRIASAISGVSVEYADVYRKI